MEAKQSDKHFGCSKLGKLAEDTSFLQGYLAPLIALLHAQYPHQSYHYQRGQKAMLWADFCIECESPNSYTISVMHYGIEYIEFIIAKEVGLEIAYITIINYICNNDIKITQSAPVEIDVKEDELLGRGSERETAAL